MRIINEGENGKTFLPAAAKLITLALPLMITDAYLAFILTKRSFLLNDDIYNSELAMKWFLVVIFALLALMVLSSLIFEKSMYIKLDPEGITFHNLFLNCSCRWEDIDCVHLGESIKEPPNFHFLAPFILPLFNLLTGFKPIHLRFIDYAYNEKRTKRFNFKPEDDGYVSIPLTLFEDPNEIFRTADNYHRDWWRRYGDIRNR